MKFAVQMYSVRDLIHSPEDMLEVLGKVKELGFDGVEFAGWAGVPAETMAARLKELGLTCVGAHVGVGDWKEDKFDETVGYLRTIGAAAGGVGGAATRTEAELEEFLSVMGAAYKKAKPLGVDVYFHTHTSEFVPPEGAPDDRTIIERISEVCDTEIDCYWSFVAGIDTCAYLRENRDKVGLVHVKDGIDGHPTALGEGQNELDKLAECLKDLGYEWIILENDDPVPDGLSDIARSMKWLKAHF